MCVMRVVIVRPGARRFRQDPESMAATNHGLPVFLCLRPATVTIVKGYCSPSRNEPKRAIRATIIASLWGAREFVHTFPSTERPRRTY